MFKRMMMAGLLGMAMVQAVLAADDDVVKQKAAIEANLKRIDLKPTFEETDHFLVVGQLPAVKAKAFGVSAEKAYASLTKSLKLEGDALPVGKIALYVFTERSKYVLFVSQAEDRRAGRDERMTSMMQSKEPYLAVTYPLGETTGNLEADVLAGVGIGMLQRKAGSAPLPEWFKDGFGRLTLMRANPMAYAADRAKVKKWLVEAKGVPAKYKAADLWDANLSIPTAEALPLAASLAEYMVYGPEAATKLPKFFAGWLVTDERPNPDVMSALKAADWTPETLDKAWKKWVMTGK